jgi:hypothetical protein
MKTHRNTLILAGLLFILLALLVNQFMTDFIPQEVPLAFRSGHALDQSRAKSPQDSGMVLKPMRLTARDSPPIPKKNLFASLDPVPTSIRLAGPPVRLSVKNRTPQVPVVLPPPPLVASPPSTLPAPPPLSPEELVAQQARAQEEAHKQEARHRLSQFRPLGFLMEKGEQRAFLGRGTEIFIIRTGDTLEKTVRVMGITRTEVILRETTTNIETTLSLAKPTATSS